MLLKFQSTHYTQLLWLQKTYFYGAVLVSLELNSSCPHSLGQLRILSCNFLSIMLKLKLSSLISQLSTLDKTPL